MPPILTIALAALAGALVGLWQRRNLATLGYRTDQEHDLPQPGPRCWVVWVSTLALGSLTATAVISNNPLAYLPLLPLTLAGPWLAAVDFDVLRLPNRVLVPTAILTLLALAGLAAATQDWSTVVLPAVAACLTGTVLAGVHVASKGGIGFGDVKLATAMSLAVGPLGVGAVWLALLAGSAAALIWVKATRRDGPIPYGPWLLCGCWIAALASAVPVRE
jgi:leader peptidase (prepilin peptidase)/N-methyltransferase